jgi:hypothetical protein
VTPNRHYNTVYLRITGQSKETGNTGKTRTVEKNSKSTGKNKIRKGHSRYGKFSDYTLTRMKDRT